MTGHIHPCGFCSVIECDANCPQAEKEGYRMTDRSKLLALAEAVAQAKGRDVPLNHEVGSAMHGLGWHPADCLLDFTGSIDGASRVFPAEAMYRSGHDGTGPDPSRFFCNVVTAAPDCVVIRTVADTEAAARLSSALRAQAEALA